MFTIHVDILTIFTIGLYVCVCACVCVHIFLHTHTQNIIVYVGFQVQV